jgi:hypothetical protein
MNSAKAWALASRYTTCNNKGFEPKAERENQFNWHAVNGCEWHRRQVQYNHNFGNRYEFWESLWILGIAMKFCRNCWSWKRVALKPRTTFSEDLAAQYVLWDVDSGIRSTRVTVSTPPSSHNFAAAALMPTLITVHAHPAIDEPAHQTIFAHWRMVARRHNPKHLLLPPCRTSSSKSWTGVGLHSIEKF